MTSSEHSKERKAILKLGQKKKKDFQGSRRCGSRGEKIGDSGFGEYFCLSCQVDRLEKGNDACGKIEARKKGPKKKEGKTGHGSGRGFASGVSG